MRIESDRELVTAMLAGRQDAFDAFFAEYFPRLFRFAVRRVRGDEDLAEDVVQEAMCRAVRKLDGYRGEAALFTWLCTFVRREIARAVRRRGGIVALEAPPDDGAEARAVLDGLAAERFDPLERERAELVHVVLDHLPAPYARALEWKYLEGAGVAEIARRMGSSAKAAESLLTRARGAFREAFETLWYEAARRAEDGA